MPEPAVKAFALTLADKMTQELSTPDAYARYFAALPSEMQEIARRPLPPGAWVPLRLVNTQINLCTEIAFGGQLEVSTEFGRRTVHRNFKTVHKVFVRLLSPAFVLMRSNLVYRMYYRDNGTATAIRKGERDIEVHHQGIAFPSPAVWASSKGAAIGSLEVSRAKNPRVEIISGGGDSRDCVFRCTWD